MSAVAPRQDTPSGAGPGGEGTLRPRLPALRPAGERGAAGSGWRFPGFGPGHLQGLWDLSDCSLPEGIPGLLSPVSTRQLLRNVTPQRDDFRAGLGSPTQSSKIQVDCRLKPQTSLTNLP